MEGTLKEGKPGKEGLKPWQVANCSATYTVKEFERADTELLGEPDRSQAG